MTLHILPGRLDTGAADGLHGALLDRVAQGQPLRLDGAAVEQVGLACLQLLISARRTAAALQLPFVIEHPSAALLEGISIAGLDALVETN